MYWWVPRPWWNPRLNICKVNISLKKKGSCQVHEYSSVGLAFTATLPPLEKTKVRCCVCNVRDGRVVTSTTSGTSYLHQPDTFLTESVNEVLKVLLEVIFWALFQTSPQRSVPNSAFKSGHQHRHQPPSPSWHFLLTAKLDLTCFLSPSLDCCRLHKIQLNFWALANFWLKLSDNTLFSESILLNQCSKVSIIHTKSVSK